MTPDEIADVLERAADALWMYGRTRNIRHDVDGAMCIVGAIEFAVNPTDLKGGYHHPATLAVESFLHDHGINLQVDTWNDDTDDDALVIDTIKHCAKDLRAVNA